MKAAKFSELIEIASLDELQSHLLSRHNIHFGSFWFWHEIGTELGLMVNREDAYLFFVSGDSTSPSQTLEAMSRPDLPITFTGGQGPTLYSSFSEHVCSPDEQIEFLATNFEATPMERLYTVPLPQAIIAVEQFFISGQRSEAISWYHLAPPPPVARSKPWWRIW